jgi:hypothetical protein
MPQPQQQQPYQQYMSPSAPASPQGYQTMSFQSSMTYPQPLPQPQLMAQTGYNPFFNQPSSPTTSQQSLTVNTAHGGYGSNPFVRSPTRIASPSLGQIPEQAQPNFTHSPFLSASPQPLPTSTNPFFTNVQQQPVQQVMQQQYAVQHAQQMYYQHQPKQDNASIMALFNQTGQMNPTPAVTEPNLATTSASIPENHNIFSQPAQSLPIAHHQPRSASQPLPGNTNPYMSQTAAQPDPFASTRHISRESMNLGMDMAWTNGRHSPDAFASLSARHV